MSDRTGRLELKRNSYTTKNISKILHELPNYTSVENFGYNNKTDSFVMIVSNDRWKVVSPGTQSPLIVQRVGPKGWVCDTSHLEESTQVPFTPAPRVRLRC